MSELTLNGLYGICHELCPVEIKLNDRTVYQDEDFDNYEQANARFKEIFSWDYMVNEFTVEVIHGHHSIISIYCE